MLIAQNIPRVRADAFDQISCLTAVTLDGKVLWQIGPTRSAQRAADQRHSIPDPRIDGDGKNEVVTARRFPIADSGRPDRKVSSWVWMPKMPPTDKRASVRLENGDSIAFVNFSGNKDRHEILVKDRYTHFWIYNNKLELLWKGDGQTGHYPYPVETRQAARIRS